VVPVGHARRLYRLAGEPKELMIVPGAGHIAALADGQARARFLSFLDRAFERNPGRREPAPERRAASGKHNARH